VAQAAGLPSIILHGTATLAKAVSSVCSVLQFPLTEVRRVDVRFSAPVLPGTDCVIGIDADTQHEDGRVVAFTVRGPSGEVALRDGLIVAGF
jgi:acyl dehydratase